MAKDPKKDATSEMFKLLKKKNIPNKPINKCNIRLTFIPAGNGKSKAIHPGKYHKPESGLAENG
ncbi:MAG: hypothetical protein Q7U53_06345 [Anaerolineaceae bacterium]|nr:hypothetical protein [Anaerolineaceae bacterium]